MPTPRVDEKTLNKVKVVAGVYKSELEQRGLAQGTYKEYQRQVEWFVEWLEGHEMIPGRPQRG